MSDISQQESVVRQLQEWEAELVRREQALRRRELELQELEALVSPLADNSKHELEGLEQRIRNARRRLLTLAEEYDRLRSKISALTQRTQPLPDDLSSPAKANTTATDDKLASKMDESLPWPPVAWQKLTEPIACLQRLVGELLDRAIELHELSNRLASIRQQWLTEWNAAIEELDNRARTLANWEQDLHRRHAGLKRAELHLARQAHEQMARQLQLQAAETRLSAHQRAWELAFKQLKIRWRQATGSLRRRELHLQWLYDEWRTRSQTTYQRWQEAHRQAYEQAQRYARLSQQCQELLAQLEVARFRLWEKQQALEAAVQTWTMQTDDPAAAEEHWRACQQRLAEHLARWEQRLQQRERQLAGEWHAMTRLLSHLYQREREIQASSQTLYLDTLAQQWQAYCRWAESQLALTKLDIAHAERDYLWATNAALLSDVEKLAVCLLQPVAQQPLSHAA